MSRVKTILFVCVVASLMLVPLAIEESDADTQPDKVFYCYTYDLGFIYSGGTIGDITVEWKAEGTDHSGNPVEVGQIEPYPSKDNGWRVKYNPEDVKKCSEILITQTVNKAGMLDSQSFKVIVLIPPENGVYKIRYYDGYTGALCFLDEITANKYVEVGEIHVSLHQPPVREGYSFQGWYLDINYNERFDERAPIQSDLNLYAKWAPLESEDSLVVVLVALAAVIAILLVILIIVLIRTRKQRT